MKPKQKLIDRLPYDFRTGEFENTKAMAFADIEVIKEYESFKKPWIGKHKYVHVWFVLANGYAVGFNENPAIGWSFPVIKYTVEVKKDGKF